MICNFEPALSLGSLFSVKMSVYNYEVPDFVSFDNLEDEDTKKIEEFLDMDHENDINATPRRVMDHEDQYNSDETFSSPTSSTASSFAPTCLENHLRKSMSSGDSTELILRNNMDNLTITENNQMHYNGLSNGDSKFRSRSVARDSTKVRQSRYTSHEDIGRQKFVSMAEAIRQFQQRTLRRFHSKSKLDNQVSGGCNYGPSYPTIHQSPALQTKRRARPLNIMSWEEKQLKDFEEAQKHQIKAKPVKPGILNTPPVLPKSKKPITVPEPFNLTRASQKSTSSLSSLSSPTYEFHAKPMPNFCKEPAIKSALCTRPRTPIFLKRTLKVATLEKEPVKPVFRGEPTKTIPFSFDERIIEMKKKKEKIPNEFKILEKEKKAWEFHAKPIPKAVVRVNQGSNAPLNKFHENVKTISQNSNVVKTFKAKPATVLLKAPFIPKKSDKPLTKIISYPSHFENRAAERKRFDQHLKEREERIEKTKEEMRLQKLKLENKEIAILRKQAVHKANPIRHYKKVESVTPKSVTKPVSSRFYSNKNKENER